jgi:DNA-binding XRE family transcriptional regulator
VSLRRKRTTSDAVEILHRRYYEGRPERIAELEDARASAAIARAAHELRTRARLSHSRLAARVGVSPAAIARIEEDDYEGDALALLQRIAAALNKSVEIRIVPRRAKPRAA